MVCLSVLPSFSIGPLPPPSPPSAAEADSNTHWTQNSEAALLPEMSPSSSLVFCHACWRLRTRCMPVTSFCPSAERSSLSSPSAADEPPASAAASTTPSTPPPSSRPPTQCALAAPSPSQPPLPSPPSSSDASTGISYGAFLERLALPAAQPANDEAFQRAPVPHYRSARH